MSKVYRVTFEQELNANKSDVWDFISKPDNLKDITPKHMNFNILIGEGEGKMYPGMIICYRLSPLPGFRVSWVTEITHVKDSEYFVDEQRFGPYSFWHHKHFLIETEHGVLMKDIVDYKIPFGILGDLANRVFVRKQLFKIFSFRKAAMERVFPA